MGKFNLEPDHFIRTKKELITSVDEFCRRASFTNLRCIKNPIRRLNGSYNKHGIEIFEKQEEIICNFKLIIWSDDEYLDNYDHSFGRNNLEGCASYPRIKEEYYDFLRKLSFDIFFNKDINISSPHVYITVLNHKLKFKNNQDKITEYGVIM